MKKSIIALVLGSVFATGVTHVVAAEEAKSPHSFTGNVSLASEYSYRGISQSDNKPALAGGADYSHASGAYVGAWASTIKWLEETSVYDKSQVEVDVYGGYKLELAKDVTVDVGVLRYLYPGDKNVGMVSPNTTEVYAALNYAFAGVKYSHSTTNLFGAADSKGSGYLDLYVNYDLPIGVQLNLHVGKQNVKNSSAFDYTDYKIGVTKDFGFASGAIAYIATTGDAIDTAKAGDALNGTSLEDWYKGRLVATLTKNF